MVTVPARALYMRLLLLIFELLQSCSEVFDTFLLLLQALLQRGKSNLAAGSHVLRRVFHQQFDSDPTVNRRAGMETGVATAKACTRGCKAPRWHDDTRLPAAE